MGEPYYSDDLVTLYHGDCREGVMSAELLREAAALIRKRAEAATPGRWDAVVLGSEGYDVRGPDIIRPRRPIRVARCGYENWDTDRGNAEYLASWHPAVALAVADWLDGVARRVEAKVSRGGGEAAVWSHEIHALAVARAYLGRQP